MAAATICRPAGQAFNPYRTFRGLFIPEAVAALRTLSPAAKLVYGHLVRRAGPDGYCHPSKKDIAEHVGFSDRHTVRAIRELESAQLIRGTTRQNDRGRSTSNAFEFLWNPIFDEREDGKSPLLEDDKSVTLPARKGDESVMGRVTDPSSTGVTDSSSPYLNRNTGKETVKVEEECAREGPFPPPPLLEEELPPGKTPAVEVRAFIAAKADAFLTVYPGQGGKPRTVEAAVVAYGNETDPGPIAEWWDRVLAGVATFCRLIERGRVNRIPDAPFYFEDCLHRRYRPEREPEPLPNRCEEPSALEPAEPIGPALSLVPSPPKQSPPPCRRCRGIGSIADRMPQLDFTMSPEEIQRLTEAARMPCPACHPIAQAATA